MTLRPAHMSAHAGQISFPGGLTESGETAEQCAVRETEEELGVGGDSFQLVGRMSPLYVFASNFCVTPCVAVSASRLEFRPNPAEVEEILELPLADLHDPDCYGVHEIQCAGIRLQSPYILCRGRRVWGATCMMLAELAAVMKGLDGDPVRRPRRIG